MTEPQRELLLEILRETDALEKIEVSVDTVSRSVVVVYQDLDDEWFRELTEISGHSPKREHDAGEAVGPSLDNTIVDARDR